MWPQSSCAVCRIWRDIVIVEILHNILSPVSCLLSDRKPSAPWWAWDSWLPCSGGLLASPPAIQSFTRSQKQVNGKLTDTQTCDVWHITITEWCALSGRLAVSGYKTASHSQPTGCSSVIIGMLNYLVNLTQQTGARPGIDMTRSWLELLCKTCAMQLSRHS